MSGQSEDRASLVERIKELRRVTEEEVGRLVAAYIEKHHADSHSYWKHAERCSIEADTWTVRQRRSTYSQGDLQP